MHAHNRASPHKTVNLIYDSNRKLKQNFAGQQITGHGLRLYRSSPDPILLIPQIDEIPETRAHRARGNLPVRDVYAHVRQGWGGKHTKKADTSIMLKHSRDKNSCCSSISLRGHGSFNKKVVLAGIAGPEEDLWESTSPTYVRAFAEPESQAR